VVAFAALALATAATVQDSGPNQAAHFALVRSLASGTAEIDPRETIDASYVDGRFYAAKAPGLAMFVLPWYGLLRLAGAQSGTPATAAGYADRIWQLGLVGTVLPFVVMLLLVLVSVERLLPGVGGTTAVLLGTGTLLLPFATLFFDHVLAATLGYAAFVVLLYHGDGPPRVARLALGGVLAGLAIVTELPLAIVAVAVAGYACAGSQPLRRVVAYSAGVLLGVVPLLLYNAWAFGSPLRLSYTNALEAEVGDGQPVVGANDEGFYGVGLPDPRAGLSLLLSEKGLAVVTPLAIVALAGLPLLWRRSRRDALVCAAIPALFVAYNAGYYLPFGGQGPGPRFLVAAMPFLALPLACVLRARPLVVCGIALASAATMALATLGGPLTGVEYGIGTWLSRLGDGDVVETVTGRIGLGDLGGAAAVALLLGVGWATAIRSLPLVERIRTDGAVALGVVLAWIVVAASTPNLVPADADHGTTAGTIAAVVLLATLAAGVLLALDRPVMLLALAPTAVLVVPQLDDRPRAALLVVLASAGFALTLWWRLGPGSYDRGS
jgi:hypothetical protein